MFGPYVVLGTPRGGTSLAAGLLHHLGVHMGESLRGADEWNRAGHFDDVEFAGLHHEALDGRHHLHVVTDPDWLVRHAALVQSRQALGKPWGLKSPSLPFLFHHLAAACPDLAAIRARRPFHESVSSWAERSHCSRVEAVQVIGAHEDACGLALERFPGRVLEWDYPAVLRDPYDWVRRLAGFVGLETTAAAIGFVDPTQRRF